MYESYAFLLFPANFLRSMSTICSSSTLLYTSWIPISPFLDSRCFRRGCLRAAIGLADCCCDLRLRVLSPDSSWRCDGWGRERILRWEEDACSDRCSQWQLLPCSPHSQSRPSGLEEPQSYCSWKPKTSLKTVLYLVWP